jgi:hypothetical protein
MNKPATTVIKNDEVRMAGRVRLGTATVHSAPAGGNTGAPQGQHHVAASTARIAKTAEDHVVIEVICGCGTKTMVRCNF